MSPKNKPAYFECIDCDAFHVLRVHSDIENKELLVELYLNSHLSFLQRLKNAISYLFKNSPNNSHFDCTILNQDSIKDLHRHLELFMVEAKIANSPSTKIKKSLDEIKQGKKNSAYNGQKSKK